MRRAGSPVSIGSMIELEPVELLYQLAVDFGLCPGSEWGMPQLWRRVTDRLSEYRYEQKQAIVLLDDADRASFDLSSHLMRLLRARGGEQSLLVILSVHPETMHRIGRRLLEQVDLRIELSTWSLDDTERHIRQALEKSGCERAAFKEDAIIRLHQLGAWHPASHQSAGGSRVGRRCRSRFGAS